MIRYIWNMFKGPPSFITSQGGVGGGGQRGVQFSKRLDLGVNFENAQNVRGVEILRHRTGLLCKSCQTILWLKQIHVSFKSRQKKKHFGGSLSATKCSHIKLSPGTYQLFLLPGMKRACTHIRLCIQPKSGKVYIDFSDFFLFRERIFFIKSG